MNRFRLRSERGSQAVELALVALVLLLVASALVPLIQLGLAQDRIARANAEGLRFATRVLPNPCRAGSPGCPFTDESGCSATLRRRPSAAEVASHVRDASGMPAGVEIALDRVPCEARSGDAIALTTSVEHGLGPLAAVANRMSALLAGRRLFPDTLTLRSALTGYQE